MLDIQLELNGEIFTVIGVVPNRALHVIFHSDVAVYASLGRLGDRIGGAARRDDHRGIYGYARLSPGVSVEQARAVNAQFFAPLKQPFVDNVPVKQLPQSVGKRLALGLKVLTHSRP